jgi:KDO2-lipid IV(A) lauroyltransferase
VLYRPPKQAWLQPLIESGRGGARFTWRRPTSPACGAAQGAARHEAVGMLPDQVPGTGEGVWADFFGRPAYTMTLAARLSEAGGRATVFWPTPSACPGGAASMHLEAPESRSKARSKRALRRSTGRWSAHPPLPQQYLWGYNRYKAPRGAGGPVSRHADPFRPRPHLAAALPAAETAGAAGRGSAACSTPSAGSAAISR